MSWKKGGGAVVIVTQRFNPSIVHRHWLVNNGILADEDFQEGCVFTDVLVQVRSARFNMLVMPEQIQFVPTVGDQDQQKVILDCFGKIITELPHTPYRAIGLNFLWSLFPKDDDIASLSRDLFFLPGKTVHKHFDVEGAHFGGYLSKTFGSFRLKLTAIPSLTQFEDGREEHFLRFEFNFHSQVGEDGANQILELLKQWDDVRQEAGRIVDSIELRQ